MPISVIIPTYNRAEQALKAIESAINQSYTDFEVLVCDDGSTDNTEERVKSVQDSRIIYLKQKNKGPGAARNLGLRNAKGEIIAFLDSDDLWLPNHLEYIAEFFKIYPEAGMAYTQNDIIYAEDTRRKPVNYKYKRIEIPHTEKKEGFWLYDGLVFGRYLESCISATPCTAVRKKVFEETGMFNEELSSSQDYEMWLRISNKYRIGAIRKPTVLVLAQAKSISETTTPERVNKNKIRLFNSIKEKCTLTEKQKRFVEEKISEYKEKIKN